MRINSLDSIGFCKAVCQDTGQIVQGRLVYFGAGRYCLQQNIDVSLSGDGYTAFRTDNYFIDITTVCEFTKMYAADETPVFCYDIIMDDAGNLYYIYWDAVKSAYMYKAFSKTASSIPLDITKTTVIGNVVIEGVENFGEINL